MADEPIKTGAGGATTPTTGASGKGQEAGAEDLMSLWGAKKQGNDNAIPTAPVWSQSEKEPAASFSPKPVPIVEPEFVPAPQRRIKPESNSPPEPAPEPEVESEPKPSSKSAEVLEGEVMEAELGKRSAEPAEPAEGDAPPEFLEEHDSLASRLEELLHEFNFSSTTVFKIIGGIVLVVVLYYGGLAGWNFYKNWQEARTAKQFALSSSSAQQKSTSAVSPSESTQQTASNKTETGIPSAQKIGKPSTIGPFSVNQTGITSAIIIGTETLASSEIAYRVDTFKKIDNAYAVNVSEMLNKTAARRERLREYVDLLKGLVDEGTKISQKINEEMVVLQTSYDAKVAKQKEIDELFFSKLNAYDGKETERVLGEFINVSRDMIDVRAKFKSIQKIKTLFEQALPKVSKRIKDIEINEEILVSGNKVYDVGGSDLQLVVPASGEDGEPTSLQSSGGGMSSFPMLPFNPASIAGGNGQNFITEPGGGVTRFTPLPVGTTTGTSTRK